VYHSRAIEMWCLAFLVIHPFFVLKTGKNPQWNKSQCCVNIEENCYCLLVTQNRRKDGCLMGIYLNPGNNKFKRAVNSDIYVDKTGLIKYYCRYAAVLCMCQQTKAFWKVYGSRYAYGLLQ